MQYGTGTASFTNGNNIITGTSTSWSGGTVSEGDIIVAPNKIAYFIDSVSSDTQISITVPYGGASLSDQSYIIHRDFYKGLPLFDDTDAETARIINELVKKVGDISTVLDGASDVYHSENLIYAQNTSGATISSNVTVAGSGLSPVKSGVWRNVSGGSISNNGYGLWMVV